MIVTDIGNDGKRGRQNVGGIKSPTQTGFDDSDLDARAGEVIESERGD
jgi:hypothetical protein